MCVDANVTRLILTVINCDPFEVFFIAIDGLKAREMRFRKYRRVFHTVAEGGGDVVSYLVHWSRAARPKLLQHRGCHKAAVMTEFTATRPPLHTLAQAVEDARGVWRRRCAARLARAASGQEHAPACSCKITQRREGDVPRQRIDCLGGGRRG